MRYTTIFFDLDGTLYAGDNGLWDAIKDRMNQYMHLEMGMPMDKVSELRRFYYLTYGTTLRGLQKHYQVDPDDYLEYVHDLPLEQYLQPAPGLRVLLHSLPQRRWIFTNADSDHAKRVLAALELDDCFQGIIDVRATDFACKPEMDAYQQALSLAGNPSPKQCVFLDDSTRNLAPAHSLGFTTVWVNVNGDSSPEADYNLADLLKLPQIMPDLWENN